MVTIVQAPLARVSARRWLSVAPTAMHQVPDGLERLSEARAELFAEKRNA